MTQATRWTRRPQMTWLALAIALAACRTMQGAAETPAVVMHPTPESRSSVSQAVNNALQHPVTFDDDTLTTTGVLVIERGQLRDAQRLSALRGRDPSTPGETERFHLMKSGERCFLVHDRTERHYELIGTVCEPR